ncbi:IAP-like protein 1 [Wolffia australiana]
MREEVISSGGTADQAPKARSASPAPTTAASSVGASSPAVPPNVGSVDYLGSTHGSKTCSISFVGSQWTRTSFSTTNTRGSALGSSQSSCRPWERGDLLCRLATFDPSNWSGKPKEADSLACARRGWINIDPDKIECETCGAHLTFISFASWTPAEVAKAGEIFVSQLDLGHRVSCPWRSNCCADSLAQFPPTTPAALIGGFKDRHDGILQFNSLPVISPSVIYNMKQSRASQVDRLLCQSYAFLAGEFSLRLDTVNGTEASNDVVSSAYSQAQRLISLCGWEPRWLPNVQDSEEYSAQSARFGCSFDPTGDKFPPSQDCGQSKNGISASGVKDTGKKKVSLRDSKSSARSPLLDCSLCGATVRIWDFLTVSRPSRFGTNIVDTPETSKKLVLTRGISAASGICGWAPADGVGKEQTEDRDEAATTDVVKLLPNAGVDLNLTMAGGLPPAMFIEPVAVERFDDGGMGRDMGRDLAIGQPSGSEVGDRAASFESRGPSTKKRSLEEGGSTVDRPLDKALLADSIEATVIDRDGDEDGDSRQYSEGPFKRSQGLDFFSTYQSSRRFDSSGAGPSRNMNFDIDIDVNRADPAIAPGMTRDSARASSVIAMDTICHSGSEDSMESVENHPGNTADDAHFSSPKNLDMHDTLDYNYSQQAQQSTCAQPATGSIGREMGLSSTNAEEEVLNAETGTVHGRDTISIGISGGSVCMGASHEAEIRGANFSVHRADSAAKYAEQVADVTEHNGQTGESLPGPGLMGEFVPEMDREDPHDDSQDVISRSAVKADSSSKVYGLAKAESSESGQKTNHPSMSCNAVIYSGYEVSKEEVTQAAKASATNDCNVLVNGENDIEGGAGEFDPIQYHHHFCPWVNGNVAAAGCASSGGSMSSSSAVAVSGWQLTLDALDAFQSLGHIPNLTLESESAASLCKDEHLTPNVKRLRRNSAKKSHGQG